VRTAAATATFAKLHAGERIVPAAGGADAVRERQPIDVCLLRCQFGTAVRRIVRSIVSAGSVDESGPMLRGRPDSTAERILLVSARSEHTPGLLLRGWRDSAAEWTMLVSGESEHESRRLLRVRFRAEPRYRPLLPAQ
jgi:hypothetical protein